MRFANIGLPAFCIYAIEIWRAAHIATVCLHSRCRGSIRKCVWSMFSLKANSAWVSRMLIQLIVKCTLFLWIVVFQVSFPTLPTISTMQFSWSLWNLRIMNSIQEICSELFRKIFQWALYLKFCSPCVALLDISGC